MIGKLGGYDPPGEQELKDLADPRHRKRGEREQKRRLKANWQLLEREAAAAEPELATTGPAVPPYLLERGDPGLPAPIDVPTRIDLDALRARLQSSAAAAQDFDEGTTADDYWTAGHLQQMARREREFLAWQEAHGDEREAQIAQLEGAGFYWAREYQSGRKPKWQLRQPEQLEADKACTLGKNELGVEEPLLLYRAFRPFTGDVLKAEQLFTACAKGGDVDARLAATEWLDGERAKLEPGEAARHSKRRCIECDQYECVCPNSDDEAKHDMLGGSSADCGADGMEEWLEQHREKLQAAEPALPDSDTLADRVLADDERRSLFYLRPAAEVPAHWAVPRDWEPPDYAELARAAREERERIDRMGHAGDHPPHRDDERYGPLADNPAGDETFRADRALWYENVTGESLDGLSLAEQRQLCDAVARRFRSYSDSRAVPPSE